MTAVKVNGVWEAFLKGSSTCTCYFGGREELSVGILVPIPSLGTQVKKLIHDALDFSVIILVFDWKR